MGMPSLAGAAPLLRAPAATLALAPPIQVPYQPPTLSSISLRGEWAAGGGERARVYGVCGVKVGGHRAEGRGIGLPKVRHLGRLLGVAARSNCANMLSREGRGDCLYSSGRSSGSRRNGAPAPSKQPPLRCKLQQLTWRSVAPFSCRPPVPGRPAVGVRALLPLWRHRQHAPALRRGHRALHRHRVSGRGLTGVARAQLGVTSGPVP